jgi:hypothetical protein
MLERFDTSWARSSKKHYGIMAIPDFSEQHMNHICEEE